MTFDLFSFDFYKQDKIYGLHLLGIDTENIHRHLFSIYFWKGLESIDLFYFRIYTR